MFQSMVLEKTIQYSILSHVCRFAPFIVYADELNFNPLLHFTLKVALMYLNLYFAYVRAL